MEEKETPPEPPAPPEPAPPAEPAPEAVPAAEPATEEGPPAEEKAKPEAKPKREPRVRERKPRVATGLLLFDRWDLSTVVVHDPGLARYINISPIIIPHTGGRYANRPFGKAKMNVVERLINNMMRTGHYTGKKAKSYRVVRRSLEIIEERTKQHPVQVLIDALEKAAPREEITRLRFGGISVPKAVDIAPSRRLDLAMRNLCVGAMQASFRTPKAIEECLANELLLAAKGDVTSFAVGKKDELERVASSAR